MTEDPQSSEAMDASASTAVQGLEGVEDAGVKGSSAEASFRNSNWSTSAVAIGVAVMMLQRSLAWVDKEWIDSIPSWIPITVAFGLQAFILVFPLVTRRQHGSNTWRLPTFQKVIVEASIAFPIVILGMVMLGILQAAISAFWPDATFSPDVAKKLAQSGGSIETYIFLTAAVLWAPLAEEIFFRGFLFNAFRVRMPFVAAVLCSGLVFGFAHAYGLLPTLAATMAGILLALIYWWRQTILTPIFVHAGVNAIGVVAILGMMQAAAEAPSLGIVGTDSDSCLIGEVLADSPADRAGVRAGDVVVRVSPGKILPRTNAKLEPPVPRAAPNFAALAEALRQYQPGDTVVLDILRDDTRLQIEAAVVPRRELTPRRPDVAD